MARQALAWPVEDASDFGARLLGIVTTVRLHGSVSDLYKKNTS
jgi:hypothetical protein